MEHTSLLLTELALDPFQQEAFARDPEAVLHAAMVSRSELDAQLRERSRTIDGWSPCACVMDPGHDPSPDPDPPEIHR